MDTRNKVFLALGTIALIGASAIGGSIIFGKDYPAQPARTTPTTTQTSTTSSTPAATPASASVSSSSYKDDTYTANQSYRVPHDNNSIRVTVVVKDGKIASVNQRL